jgi:hypothetical protein
MKLISIVIGDEDCRIKWESKNHSVWTVASSREMGKRFGDAVKALSGVAAKSINHDAELMAVRSVVVSENNKGITFVKLAGVLAATQNQEGKAGKFTTPKIEITLFANAEMREMETAAGGYVKECEQE